MTSPIEGDLERTVALYGDDIKEIWVTADTPQGEIRLIERPGVDLPSGHTLGPARIYIRDDQGETVPERPGATKRLLLHAQDWLDLQDSPHLRRGMPQVAAARLHGIVVLWSNDPETWKERS